MYIAYIVNGSVSNISASLHFYVEESDDSQLSRYHTTIMRRV